MSDELKYLDETDPVYEEFSGVKPFKGELSDETREKYPFFVEIPYDPENGYDSIMRRWKKGFDELSVITPEVIESFVNNYGGVPAAMGNYFELKFLADTNVILPFARQGSSFDNESSFHMGYFERAVQKITERKNLPLWILYRNPERKDKSGKVFDVPHVGALYRYNPHRGNITLLVKGSPRTFKLSRIQAYAVVPASCSNLLHVKFELSEDDSRVRWESSPERFPEMWGYLSSLEVLSLELAREREAEKKRWLREEALNREKQQEEERALKERQAKDQAREARRAATRQREAEQARLAEERREQKEAYAKKRREHLRAHEEKKRKAAEEKARQEAEERARQAELLKQHMEEQKRLREEEERAKKAEAERIRAEIKAQKARDKAIREARKLERALIEQEEQEKEAFRRAFKREEEDTKFKELVATISEKLKPLEEPFQESFGRPLDELGELALSELSSYGLAVSLGSRVDTVASVREELKDLFMIRAHGELAHEFDGKYLEMLLREFRDVYVEVEDLTKHSRMFMRVRAISVDSNTRTIIFEDGSARYGAHYDAFRLRKANTSSWVYAPLWSR